MLKALSLVGSARILSTASQALTLLILARSLGPSDFAVVAAVLGGLMALNLVADGGATYAVGRHHESNFMIVQILRACRLLSYGTMLISVPILGCLAYVSHSAILAACLPLCAWVPLERQLEVYSAYLMSRNRQVVVGGGYLLRRMPTLAAVLLLSSTPYLVWAYSVTTVLTAAVAMVLLGRSVVTETSCPSSGLALIVPNRETWSVLRPFWAAIAGQGVRQLDVAVLTFITGTAVAGIFAPVSRMVPALLLVPGTYTQLLLARLAATKEVLTTRTLAVLGGLTAAVFAPLAIFANYWIPLLLGDAYLGSVDVARIVIASLVFAAMSSAYASGLHATDGASRVAAVVWISATTSLVLIAALGSLYGAVGAAWAVALSYALQFFLMAGAYRFRPTHTPLLVK